MLHLLRSINLVERTKNVDHCAAAAGLRPRGPARRDGRGRGEGPVRPAAQHPARARPRARGDGRRARRGGRAPAEQRGVPRQRAGRGRPAAGGADQAGPRGRGALLRPHGAHLLRRADRARAGPRRHQLPGGRRRGVGAGARGRPAPRDPAVRADPAGGGHRLLGARVRPGERVLAAPARGAAGVRLRRRAVPHGPPDPSRPRAARRTPTPARTARTTGRDGARPVSDGVEDDAQDPSALSRGRGARAATRR